MKNYFEEIRTKLNKELISRILRLLIIHINTRAQIFFTRKISLHLKIKSLYLNSISRVTAHKMIMKVLKDDLKTKIHALEISIEK